MRIPQPHLPGCLPPGINPPRHRSVLMMLGFYSPESHRGIAHYAAEHGWHLNAEMANVPIIPSGWMGDGVIAGLGQWKAPVRFVNLALARGIPVVDICCGRPEIPLPRVIGDHMAIGQMAAEHFLERGWQHFGWFARGRNNPVAEMRCQGYSNALAQRGYGVIRLGRSLHINSTYYQWPKTIAQLVKELSRAPKPLAVLAHSDFNAAILMEACDAAGYRIPDDVALLGVDDNEFIVNSVRVPLSSIQHDMQRIGYEGAALLDRLMQGEPPPQKPLLIPPRGIIVRASTDTYAVNHPALSKALRFMKENLQRSIGVEEVAAASGLSSRGLQEAFRKEWHQSVHDELLDLRVQAAKHLLARTQLSIEHIAARAGFSHSPHLHRIFRERFGVTPRAFRQSCRTVS